MPVDCTQSDLFPLSGTPEWLPDETLFSLCSRYHNLSGNLLASSSCQQLFGHAQRGAAHDFPSKLSEFAARTHGLLGTAEEIIRGRTLLPYYLPLRSIDDEVNAMSAMCGDGIGSLKFQLGILTSRFGANHPLRACSKCMREDEKIYGVAYWHLQHQYPGAWICIHHELPLITSTEKSNGVGRFQWLLPTHDAPPQEAPDAHVKDRHLPSLMAVAKSATQLAGLPKGFHFDAQVLTRTYHTALFEYGLATATGALKNPLIGSAYFEFTQEFPSIYELSSLPKDVDQSTVQVLRLLRTPRSGTHPLRHLLLIRWLFQDWDNFWQRYQHNELIGEPQANKIEGDFGDNVPLRQADAYRDVIYAVQHDHFSARRAASLAGVDVSTAMNWLAKAGISSKRRPKKLKDGMRQRLIADLKAGMDKQLAAQKHEISVSTVMKTLGSEVGLYDAWLYSRRDTARKVAHAEWLQLRDIHPHAGTKQLREMNARVYAWLYRNDRAWLAEESKKIPRLSRSMPSNVDWHVRDVNLSEQVQRATFHLLNESPGKKILLWHLYQILPELKSKLDRLERLPLTRKAIDVAIESEVSEAPFDDFLSRL